MKQTFVNQGYTFAPSCFHKDDIQKPNVFEFIKFVKDILLRPKVSLDGAYLDFLSLRVPIM